MSKTFKIYPRKLASGKLHFDMTNEIGGVTAEQTVPLIPKMHGTALELIRDSQTAIIEVNGLGVIENIEQWSGVRKP